MRLFIAVHPPEHVLDQVEELVWGLAVSEGRSSHADDAAGPAGRRGGGRGIRWTTRARWHITLRFLGEVGDPAEVVDALGGASLSAMGPIEAAMGPAVERLGAGVLCVPVSGLDGLAGAVTRATAEIGRPPETRPFHGHLTLARLPRKGRVDTRPWVGQAIGARWPVDQVHLMRSHTDPDGARYETVHTTDVGA
jgi:RNA 2',3'-cyclic 3'-phosphodiesterase